MVKKLSSPICWSLALFIVGGLCFILYSIIGVHVDQNGVLHEAFFLIPIGYLFLLFGLGFLVTHLLNKRIHKR